MIDERLGELERRWRESGDPQDEARLIFERARSGELPQGCLALAERLVRGRLERERLELAAFLGDPDALAMMPGVIERVSYLGHVPALRVLLGDPIVENDVRAWAGLLPRFGGLEAVVRALLALTRAHARAMEAPDFRDLSRWPAAVESSVLFLRGVIEATERTLATGRAHRIDADGNICHYEDIGWLARRAHTLALRLLTLRAKRRSRDLDRAVHWLVFDRSAAAIPAARVPGLVREELLPWALAEPAA